MCSGGPMPPGQVLQMKTENVSLAPGGALCSGVQPFGQS